MTVRSMFEKLMRVTIFATFCGLFLSNCAREENPYLNRYRGQVSETSDANGTGSGIGTNSSSNTTINGNEVAEPVVADPDKIPEESLNFTEVVCSQGNNLQDMATEFGVLCIDGKPSSVLVELLEGGYKGEGEPDVKVIKSEVVDGVVELIFAMSSIIEASSEDIITRRDRLANMTFTEAESQATMATQKVADIAGDGAKSLGGFEVIETLTVPSPLGDVVTPATKQAIFYDLGDKKILMNKFLKKKNDPANTDTASNLLVFYNQQENGTTKSVIVTFQQITIPPNVPGAFVNTAYETAMDTGLKVATEAMKQSWSILSKP